jgi:hypothetical protein
VNAWWLISRRLLPIALTSASLFPLASTVRASSVSPELTLGASIKMGPHQVALRKIVTLPYVESDYTKPFHFDAFDNPKLVELRQRYQLTNVIAPGQDEFDQQVRLMDWTHRQFKRFGAPSLQVRGALEILQGIEEGHSFFCSQYAQVLVSAAASLGWVDRELALRRHQGIAQGGSTEHTTTEIWSNQYRKWVMLDPTSNLYLEKEGVPLNAFEIRQEWFYRAGKDLVFVVGKERNRYRRSDLPVALAYFAGFGELAISPDELDKYGFIAYIPNTNLMDEREDYARMFIVKDSLCEGTPWHIRRKPEKPATDLYFPIGQTALTLRAAEPASAVSQNLVGALALSLRTFTPNFERFEIEVDGGGWRAAEEHVLWKLHPGINRFQAVAVNRFGVRGPVAVAEVEVR